MAKNMDPTINGMASKYTALTSPVKKALTARQRNRLLEEPQV